MPGPRPDDVYNPVPSAPTLGMPSDYATQRATPEAFGSQIGQSLEKVGSQFTDTANKEMDYQLQVQGLANEHAANVADTALAVQGGQVYDEYKQLTGLEAANKKDSYIQKYLGIYNGISKNLGNPMAQKAFETIATRRMSFTVQDMNAYAALQTKQAYRQGREDSKQLSISSALRTGVANNDAQFGDATANVMHQLNADYTDPGSGLYPNTPVKQGPDGKLQFDTSTTEGKIAQNDYDNHLNIYLGKLWTNRAESIATGDLTTPGDPLKAAKMLQENEKSIPPAAYNELVNKLKGPVQSETVRSYVDTRLGETRTNYLNSPKTSETPWVRDAQDQTGKHVSSYVSDVQNRLKNIPNPTSDDIVHALFGQESTFGKNTKPNGVSVGPMQITPGTFALYAHPGEDINNTDDNMAVGKRIVEDLYKKFNGDPSKIATAYFSGEGNVGKGQGNFSSNYVNQLKENQAQLVQETRDYFHDHGYDVTVQDQAAGRMEARIAELQKDQNAQNKAYRDQFIGLVSNPDHPISNINSLMYSGDPVIRKNWLEYQAADPWGAAAIEARVKANAGGKARTYGTDFYHHFSEVLDGKSPTDLQDYFTDGSDKSPISNSGIPALDHAHDLLQTPQGQAFAASEKKFLEDVRNHMTSPRPGLKTPGLEDIFNKSLMTLIPRIEAGYKAGKGNELFDPKSPEYVGKGLAYPTKAQITAAATTASIQASVDRNLPVHLKDITDPNLGITELHKRLKAGEVTPRQAADYAIQRGWRKPAKAAEPQKPIGNL